ncbi:MAG TPA: hypothetical protein VJP40_02705 [bacterium]|nr:hypothetical protein [bacterium]
MSSRIHIDAERRSLTREPDPELRGEGLLSLAGRQERAHRPELAIEIYSELLSSAETPAFIRERAQRRLDAYRGLGNLGDRAEILFSRFSAEATEPTTLLAMTAAGLAFRVSRFVALSRLAASPNAGLWTRGFGARTLAGSTGFGVEAAVFPLAGRLGHLALGREQDWSYRALGGELASSYLMLGALRAGGMATAALSARTNLLRPALQQTGMFGGILLGQELEVRAGLRERTSAGVTLIDGLSTLVQFNVAGRLNRSLLGEGMSSWERRIEQQSEVLGRTSWPAPRLPEIGHRPALSLVSAAIPFNPSSAPLGAEPNLAVRLPESPLPLNHSSGAPLSSPAAEIRVPRDGRSRTIDRALSPNIRIIEGQGVFWLIDGDTQDRRRNFVVRVGEEILRPGGSLRIRPGDSIQLGDRVYHFAGAELSGATEISVRRALNFSFPQADAGFQLHFPVNGESFPADGRHRIASGPQGDVFMETRSTENGRLLRIEAGSAEIRSRIELRGRHWILDNIPVRDPLLTTIFLDWLATQAYVEAATLEVPNVAPAIHRILEHGLIQESYTRQQGGPGGYGLVARPRSTLLPPELGERHRAAADRAFAEWSERRLGFRIPTLAEIEAGNPIAPIDKFGVEPNMEAILRRLVRKDGRFLEVGYGGRLETLQAVERLGGRALGLELNASYPAGVDPAELRGAELDTLFLNGSPFLFFAGHQVSLPGAFDLLRPGTRAQTLLIQAYNPRTPFEILRHFEELHGLVFEPLYYRPAASLAEAPLFPTDWCQRPDTRHAVLVARRVSSELK